MSTTDTIATGYRGAFRRILRGVSGVPADTGETGGLERRISRATFWSLGGAIISRGMTFLLSVFLARTLDVEGFGKLAIVQSTLLFLSAFSVAGLGLSTTKFVAEYRAASPYKAFQYVANALTVAGVFGGVIAIVCAFGATAMAELALGDASLSPFLLCSSLFLIFSSIASVQSGALVGLELFRENAMVNIARACFQIVAMLGGALYWGLLGVVLGMSLAELGTAMLSQRYLDRAAPGGDADFTSPRWDPDTARTLTKFSLPAFLSSMVTQPALWITSVMLVRQPEGFEALAIFNAADRYRQMLVFLPTAVAPVALSLLSGLQGKGAENDFRFVFRLNILAAVACVLVPSIVLMAFPRPLLGLFGAEYQAGGLTLTLLAGSAVLIAANTALGHVLISTGHIWWRFLTDLILAVCLVAASMLLISPLRDAGLAIAHLAGYGIPVVILMFLAKHILARRASNSLDPQPAREG